MKTKSTDDGGSSKINLKWLDTGVMYSIADFEWVSPIHVVSKNEETTIA